MANKRTLKKQINLICEELFVDFVAASLYGNAPNHSQAEAVLFSIIKLRNNYISRISHPEPGMPAKQYYNKLKEDFIAQASDINDQICNM